MFNFRKKTSVESTLRKKIASSFDTSVRDAIKDLGSKDLASIDPLFTRVRDKFSMQTVLTALIFQHKQAEPQVYCQKSNRLLGQNIGS